MNQDLVVRIVLPVVTALFGVVVGHLLTERRARITRLRHWIETARVADPPPGLSEHPQSLEVRYNGRPVTDLHVSTIHVDNEGPADLRDLVLIIRAAGGITIISASGTSEGNPDPLRELDAPPIAEAGGKLWGGEASKMSRREFAIPVLNRRHSATLTLVFDKHASEGTISLSCNHVGVRLVQGRPTDTMNSVTLSIIEAALSKLS